MLKLLLVPLFMNASGPVPRSFPMVKAQILPSSPALETGIQYKTYNQWKEDQVAYWGAQGRGEMAKDFTMADYFAGYLTRQKNQLEAIKQVSSRLSSEEVAELMMIYANSVFGTQAGQLPVRADNIGKQLQKEQ